MIDPISRDHSVKSFFNFSKLNADLFARYVLTFQSYELHFVFISHFDVSPVRLKIPLFPVFFCYYEILIDYVFELS